MWSKRNRPAGLTDVQSESTENIEATVPTVGAVRFVIFGDGIGLSAVLCPGHSDDPWFAGPYWLAARGAKIWSEFAANVSCERVEPSLLDPAEETECIASLAACLRNQILDSLPERQAAAEARLREDFGESFDPAVDYVGRVGPDPVEYAQYVDVLHALAARFTRAPLLSSVPLPTEED